MIADETDQNKLETVVYHEDRVKLKEAPKGLTLINFRYNIFKTYLGDLFAVRTAQKK